MNTERTEKFVNAIACDLEEGGFRQVSGTTLRRTLAIAVSAALPLLEAGNPVSGLAEQQGAELPPLPASSSHDPHTGEPLFTESKMRMFANAALAATGKQQVGNTGCGACGDGCADRPACRVAEESPPAQVGEVQGAPWRDHSAAVDSKALATATEIALMWGQDRSQFVSRIQVAVIDAMQWMKGGLLEQPAQGIDLGQFLPHTTPVIDKLQDVMATHGFAVPVRVISDAFRNALNEQRDAAPGVG